MEDTLSLRNVLRIVILEYVWYFWELFGRIWDSFLRYVDVSEGRWGVFGSLSGMFGVMGWLLVAIWSVPPFLGTPFQSIVGLG